MLTFLSTAFPVLRAVAGVDPQDRISEWGLIPVGLGLTLLIASGIGFRAYVMKSLEPPKQDDDAG